MEPDAGKAVNVKVVVRVRPLNEQESGTAEPRASRPTWQARDLGAAKKRKKQGRRGSGQEGAGASEDRDTRYAYDRVFCHRRSGTCTSRPFSPSSRILQGFNCTVFAYGQTGVHDGGRHGAPRAVGRHPALRGLHL